MEKDSLEMLKVRKALCVLALNVLAKVDDPLQPAAVKRYQGELEEIEQEIANRLKPPPVVVGLKRAKVKARKL
mgnify:CR=1 FL=1